MRHAHKENIQLRIYDFKAAFPSEMSEDEKDRSTIKWRSIR
jgi:hypothetical protein